VSDGRKLMFSAFRSALMAFASGARRDPKIHNFCKLINQSLPSLTEVSQKIEVRMNLVGNQLTELDHL